MPRTTQRSFTGGEISPALHNRVDLAKYQTSLAIALNSFVHAEGGISNRQGTTFVAEVQDSSRITRLIEFEFNTEQAYALEFGHNIMRPFRDSGQILEPTQPIVSVTEADPGVMEVTGHGWVNGDEVFVDSGGDMTQINNKNFVIANVTANTFELTNKEGVDVDTSGYTTYTGGGAVARVFTLSTIYSETEVFALKFTQSADTMTLVHLGYDPYELTRSGHAAWTHTIINFAPTQAAPTALVLTTVGTGGGSNTKTYEYVITAVNDAGEESLQSVAAAHTVASLAVTFASRITWTAPAGTIDYYNIYKAESFSANVYGLIGTSNTLIFEDFNIKPDIAFGPPVAKLPFSGADDKPSTVNYWQQRIIYASTNNNPQGVFISESGNYKSMRNHTPVIDSDAIEFTIASKKVNEIRHIVSLDALLLLTSGGEWRVSEGADEVLTPASVGVKQQSYNGTAEIEPIVVDNTALYAQDRGTRVRDIGYTFESDSYTGSDLSILVRHLFEEIGVTHSIIDWTYQKEPFGIIWAVRDDGILLSFTYQKEHQVWAWARHTTDGLFESVVSIPGDIEDDVYFVVARTINGVNKRYIEQLHTRAMEDVTDAFFMDCGLTYDGPPVTTISNLDHIEGKAVAILADGNVVSDKVVTNGSITLDNLASKVHIGLPYVSDVETLDIDSAERTFRASVKNVSEVTIAFKDTRGGFVGPDVDNLLEIKPRDIADNYDTIPLRTRSETISVSPKWTEGGRTFFRQVDPLPFTILSITPNFDISA